ncbi:MAG: LCP family protein [Actinomycetota bacterium]
MTGVGRVSARAFLGRIVIALVLATAVVVAGLVTAFRTAEAKVASVASVPIDPALLRSGGNFLLIGSDSRAFVRNPKDADSFGEADVQTGQRSDTIMVAHIDRDPTRSFLVSFPRDLWVDVPGIGESRINAAFNEGPQRVIRTLQQNWGIPIQHYLEVDFAGFRRLVDALGSVPIFFPAPARDEKTGLLVKTKGCHRLRGEMALAFVRSRYYESFVDGEWEMDGTSDLGRIKRQQYFLRTVAAETLRRVQSNPWEAPTIVDAMLSSFQRDQGLGFAGLRDFLVAFRGQAGQPMKSLSLPVERAFRDGQDVLILDDQEAWPVLSRLIGGKQRREAGTASAVTGGVAPATLHRASAPASEGLPPAGC